jgi:hypothetical protein
MQLRRRHEIVQQGKHSMKNLLHASTATPFDPSGKLNSTCSNVT